MSKAVSSSPLPYTCFGSTSRFSLSFFSPSTQRTIACSTRNVRWNTTRTGPNYSVCVRSLFSLPCSCITSSLGFLNSVLWNRYPQPPPFDRVTVSPLLSPCPSLLCHPLVLLWPCRQLSPSSVNHSSKLTAAFLPTATAAHPACWRFFCPNRPSLETSKNNSSAYKRFMLHSIISENTLPSISVVLHHLASISRNYLNIIYLANV